MIYIGKMTEKKIQAALIFLTAFMTIVLFSVSFYTESDIIGTFLMENLSFDIEIMDTHYFSSSRYRFCNNVKADMAYYFDFIDSLQRLTEEKEVSYADFNPVLNVRYENVHFYNEDGRSSSATVFNYLTGINREGFFDRESLKIIEGRAITQKEIDRGEKVIVLSDNAYIEKDGEIRKAHPGDKVTVIYTSIFETVENSQQLFTEEYTVIGIYESAYVFDRFYGRYDNFINGDNSIISANIVLENVPRYVYNAGYSIGAHPFISHIMFEAESYNDYKILLGKVEEFVESYNKKTELSDVNTGQKVWPARADLQLKEQNIENLEKAISRINELNSISYRLLLALAAFMFLLVFYYVQKNNRRNLSILYSLGMKKKKIICLNTVQQLLESIIAVIIGSCLGAMFSKWSVLKMMENNVLFHNELVNLSNTGILINADSLQNISFYEQLHNTAFKTAFIILAMSVMATVITSSFIIMREKGFRGGN